MATIAATKTRASRASSDAVVTARVPRAIKQRGDAVLREIGATPTKLVNAAYDFVLSHGCLPGKPAAIQNPAPGLRTLDAGGKRRIASIMEGMRVSMPQDERDFEQLREAAMRERFAPYFERAEAQ